MLFWEEYSQGHDAAPVGPIEAQLSPFKGPQPGPILGDALDMDPNDPFQAFQSFFPPEYFEKMLAATNSYGRLISQALDYKIKRSRATCFSWISYPYWPYQSHWFQRTVMGNQNSWKGNKFCRSVMTYNRNNRFEMILRAWHYENYAQHTV